MVYFYDSYLRLLWIIISCFKLITLDGLVVPIMHGIFFTTVENGALHVAPPHMHIIANSAYLLKQWLITALRDNGNLSKQKKTCQFCSLLADRRLTVQMATGKAD